MYALFAAAIVGLPASASPPADQNEVTPGIIAVQENGHTVYVNAPSRENPRARARHSVLVYWSNKEHRWKPVPPPTPGALISARSAAAEVAGYVASRPRGRSLAARNPNYAAMARGYRVSTAQIDEAIEQAARKHNVDPNLVRAIIKVESNFNPSAVSSKGAMGLMQLMPDTARSLSVNNPFDPQQNVDAGVRHLKQLLSDYHGDVTLSLAAYNAGSGAVARNHGVPPYSETRNYVKRITGMVGGPSGTKTFGTGNTPLRMYRGADGVLRITNTE
jgi:soluble lytic murein transglycosylase-like protein